MFIVIKYQTLGQGLVTWNGDVSDRCQKNESIRKRVEWALFSSLSRASPGEERGLISRTAAGNRA